MCNEAMACSVFRKSPNVHKKKKIEKKRKQRPKTAPWLRTPEPPETERKEKGKEKMGGVTPWPQRKKKGGSAPQDAHTKTPQQDPQSMAPQSNPDPGQQKVPKSQASAHSLTTLPKLPRTHPHPPPSPPPQPVGLGPRAHSEGTWPSTAGHHEASSPSSSVRYPA